MGKKCAVISCSSLDGPFFAFPRFGRDGDRLQKWIVASGNVSLLKVPKENLRNRFICKKHFPVQSLFLTKLTKTAIPTLHLPTPLDLYIVRDEFENSEIDLNFTMEKKENTVISLEKYGIDLVNEIEASQSCSKAATLNNETAEITEKNEFEEASLAQELNNLITEEDRAKNVNSKKLATCHQKSANKSKKTKSKKKRRSLLTMFNISKKAHLSDHDHNLYNFICSVVKENRACRKRNENLKERVRRAENCIKFGWINTLDGLLPQARSFFECQLRNSNRNKFSRQYTIDDKLFAFTLYKRSPTAYRYLANVFCLPSERNVRQLSSELPLKSGICDEQINSLQEQGKKFKDPKDRLCVLMCDDVEIQTSVSFNENKEKVEGFVDNGIEKQREIADHATVWLVKGVNPKIGEKTWKQPLVYTFCKTSQSCEDFKKMYLAIVRRLRDIDFTVIASVCDQGSTNEKAVRELIEETKVNLLKDGKKANEDIIMVDNLEIVHIFDPPHLIKCLRNNLLTKDLVYTWEGKERIASWSQLEKAFEIDKQNGIFRLFQKLSTSHIYPNNREKMRVSLCKNVFSHSTASSMMTMCNNKSKSLDGKLQMDEKGLDTALLFHIIDNVFDSLNCHEISKNTDNSEVNSEKYQYKNVISTNGDCPHENLWDSAIEMFKSMKYVKKKPYDREKPNVLNNFVHTLMSFKILRKKMKIHGFSHFSGNVFNQDPVENLFCQLKQHGIRNTKPTTVDFSSYYKSVLVNTVVHNNTRGSNCIDDDSSGFLVTMKSLFNSKSNPLEIPWDLPKPPDGFNILKSFPDTSGNFLDNLSGKDVLNCLDVSCFICKENLLSKCDLNGCVEKCDKDNFRHCFLNICSICFYFFPIVAHKDNFLKKIREFLLDNVSFRFKDCEHVNNLKEIVINKCTAVVSKHYFTFLQKLGKGFPLPPEHDELMKIVYNSSQRFKKKGCTPYAKNVAILYTAEGDKKAFHTVNNDLVKNCDTSINVNFVENNLKLQKDNTKVYVPKTKVCNNDITVRCDILKLSKDDVKVPVCQVRQNNVYDKQRVNSVQLKVINNNDSVPNIHQNNMNVNSFNLNNIKNNVSLPYVVHTSNSGQLKTVNNIGSLPYVQSHNKINVVRNANIVQLKSVNNNASIPYLSRKNINVVNNANNVQFKILNKNNNICVPYVRRNNTDTAQKENIVQIKSINNNIYIPNQSLSYTNASDKKMIQGVTIPNKKLNNTKVCLSDLENCGYNINVSSRNNILKTRNDLTKANTVQLKNNQGIISDNNSSNLVFVQRTQSIVKHCDSNKKVLIINGRKESDHNLSNILPKIVLKRKCSDTTAYLPIKKNCDNSIVKKNITVYHKLYKNN